MSFLPVCPVCKKEKGLTYAIVSLKNCDVCWSCFWDGFPSREELLKQHNGDLELVQKLEDEEFERRAKKLEAKASRMMKDYL